MKISEKIMFMLSFVIAASIARFTSMNSSMDLVTPLLLSMSFFCDFVYGITGWALFGIVFEISILYQGAPGMVFIGGSVAIIPVIEYFLIEVLTCVMIGLVVYMCKLIAKRGFVLTMPIVAGLVKWVLMFGQDFWTLVFNPSVAPGWVAYHVQSMIYALAKVKDGVLWTIPIALIIVIYQYMKDRRQVGVLYSGV